MNSSKFFIPFVLLLSLIFTNCDSSEDIVEDTIKDPFELSIADIVSHNNKVYVGSSLNGVFIYENGEWSHFTQEDGLINDTIVVLAVSEDDILWVGTQRGIAKYSGNTWTAITVDDGLFSNDIRALYTDSEQNLWIGTRNNRLVKFDGSLFETYHVNPEASGPAEMGHIHTVSVDQDKNVWVGSCISGLSVFDGTSWSNGINNLNVFVETSVCTSNGDVWCGHISDAYQLKNDIWVKHDSEGGLAANIILDFATDENNNIWVATGTGLSKYDGTNWTAFTSDDGLPDNYVKAIACDNSGIWVGTGTGLAHLDL